MQIAPSLREGWRSRTTFILALSASAVGLGNLWRFSYLSGEHGGAPFVLTYIACLFFIAVPVMVAEVVIGSHGRAGPIAAIRHASDRSLASRGWMLMGVLACLTGFLILVLYSVVAAWGMVYAGYVREGLFSAATAAEVGARFSDLMRDPVQQANWLGVFVALTGGVVLLGVRRGLGLLVWLVVPALLAMLAFLIKYGFEHGDIEATQNFLFSTRWIDFDAYSALVALGHAFFTLGVGVATGICYGAYAPERIPVGRSVMAVAVFDSMIAILAGLAIFPIVFANNLSPTFGPGLMFVTLPYVFGNIVQGEAIGTIFFLMVVLAALGSAVAIMEPIVASLKQHTRLERFTSVLLVSWSVWLLGVAVIASFTPEAELRWYGNRNLFEFLDLLSADLMLPLVSLLLAIFVGWNLRPEILRGELGRESNVFFVCWRFSLRYLVPLAIGLMMLAPLFAPMLIE